MTARERTSLNGGFTLIELLVVIAIVVTMAALLVGGLGGTGKVANLQAAQSLITNVLTTARAKAVSSQRRTRVIFHTDAGTGQPSGRFLRYFALQQLPAAESEWRIPGDWVTIKTYSLPEGTYVLPYDLIQFPNLLFSGSNSAETNWEYHTSKFNGKGSLLFQGGSVSIDLSDGYPEGNYQGVMFTERGTISVLNGGGSHSKDTDRDLVGVILGTGNVQAPDASATNSAPIMFTNSNEVRAVQLSTYGVPILVNNREDF